MAYSHPPSSFQFAVKTDKCVNNRESLSVFNIRAAICCVHFECIALRRMHASRPNQWHVARAVPVRVQRCSASVRGTADGCHCDAGVRVFYVIRAISVYHIIAVSQQIVLKAAAVYGLPRIAFHIRSLLRLCGSP